MASIVLGREKSPDYISLLRFNGRFAFDDPDPETIGTPSLPIRSFDALSDQADEIVQAIEDRLKQRNPLAYILQAQNRSFELQFGDAYTQFVDYEFMAVAVEGSVRFEGGELRISFKGLGLLYGLFQATTYLGGLYAGGLALDKMIDVAKVAIPHIEAAISEVTDLDPMDFERNPRPADDIAREFLHRLREDRETLSDLEALGIDLQDMARQLALELGETEPWVRSEDREPPITH